MPTEIPLDEIARLYSKLGEAGIRRLVDRFYDIMDADPNAAEIRKLHPADLSRSREKLYMFLVGRFGGPPLYAENYGHPMLRAKHAPFPIGDAERDQWMMCMTQSLGEMVKDERAAKILKDFFKIVADSMRNQ